MNKNDRIEDIIKNIKEILGALENEDYKNNNENFRMGSRYLCKSVGLLTVTAKEELSRQNEKYNLDFIHDEIQIANYYLCNPQTKRKARKVSKADNIESLLKSNFNKRKL